MRSVFVSNSERRSCGVQSQRKVLLDKGVSSRVNESMSVLAKSLPGISNSGTSGDSNLKAFLELQ